MDLLNRAKTVVTSFRQSLKQSLSTKRLLSTDDGGRSVRVAPPLVAVALVLLGTVILRNAWVSDDADILVRTLENFANGYGLRWNVAERVQVFTCPLWTLLLAPFYCITGEAYFTIIAVSTTIALLGGYLLVFRAPRRAVNALLLLVILLFSRAFIDFSTSGLENALSHLLIILYYFAFSRAAADSRDKKSFIHASVLFGLAVLNRMDLLVLLLPAQLLILVRGQSARAAVRRTLLWAACCSPYILWLLFSLFYYGFPFPNTAYAKLATGISSYVLMLQGLAYLRNCLDWDPITVLSIASAIVVGFSRGPARRPVRFVLALGILLSVIYVVRVGGDHMSGRFFTPSLMLSLLTISSWRLPDNLQAGVLIVLFVAVGFTGYGLPMWTHSDEEKRDLDKAGIVDDRNFAALRFGIHSMSPTQPMVANLLANRGTRHRRAGAHTVLTGHIGLFGATVGPEVSIVDVLGLTDPLTARLSFGIGDWRPAHFVRWVPEGYVEEREGTGRIADGDLRRYYAHLKTIVSGDLWSWNRIKEIARFNFGAYDYLKERYEMRRTAVFNYRGVSGFRRDRPGIPWNEKDNKILGAPGIGIRIPPHLLKRGGLGAVSYSVSLAGGERYDVYYLSGGSVVAEDVIDLSDSRKGVLKLVSVEFDSDPTGENRPINLIRFKPRGSFGRFSFGHFRIERGPKRMDATEIPSGGAGLTFGDQDVDVVSATPMHHRKIHLNLPQESVFRFQLFSGRQLLWQTVAVRDAYDTREDIDIPVPQFIHEKGYDRIRVTPVSGPPDSRIAAFSLH